MPSCAMRSATSILTIESHFPQTYFQFIHCLDQVCLLEVSEVTHAENLPIQVCLSTGKNHLVLFTQLLQQRLRINAIRCQYSRDGVRCVLVIGKQLQSHLFSAPTDVFADAR